MKTRAKKRASASSFGVPVGAALMLAGCTTAQSCRREPAPGRPVETSAKPGVEAARPIDCPAGLLDARRGGSHPDRYSVPSDKERVAMAELIARLVAGGVPARAQAASDAAALGYQIDDVAELPGVVLLRELAEQRRGGGAYLFRLDRTSKLIVQAPHTFFDEGTLQLGCDLFARAGAAALFIDTAHRYKAAEMDHEGNYPADVAHAPDSLFHAATQGALRAIPNATVIQLHGFAARESGAAVVLSNGSGQRGGELPSRAQRLLAPLVTGRVVRFPDETSELGGTTNVQGVLVREAGGSFLHVELTADLRKNLLADADLRARFLGALARSLAGP